MSGNDAYGRLSATSVRTQEDVRPMILPVKNAITLRIGDVCCSLTCRDADDCRKLEKIKRLYHGFLTQEPGNVTVELAGTDFLSPEELTSALAENKYTHEENIFRSTSQVVAGQYDLTRGYIKITGERNLINPDMECNHLNQLLSLAYYTACKMAYSGSPPAMIIHSCGILRSGQAMLFTGPSEAGKTTIARLCGKKDGEVINDEMLLVSRPGSDSENFTVESGPFLGKYPSRRILKAPLRCIFQLKKGDKTGVRRVDRSEAYLNFMRQIITPAYIGQKDKRTVLSLMSEFSDDVTRAVPVYELEFNLDGKSLWRTVEELQK
jgi:hypothetical protein